MPSYGPHRARSHGVGVYRGSRKRLRQLKWYEHTSIEFWVVVVLLCALFFGLLPWMLQHSSHGRGPAADFIDHPH